MWLQDIWCQFYSFSTIGTDGLSGDGTAIVQGVTAGYRDYGIGRVNEVETDPAICPTRKGFLTERSHT